ncbi:fibronectin type III domain-containing protein [Flagellimonas pacifica]|uniref:Chitodextrinase n=1 Tax=Flagellimonas pacifica TaxID=1247520 RepID=A0A285MC78_9FLAO|nr:fibronectin type III domain-containing protein [Allomuricauda parva]SNY94077.1 Chitodextrinase [Allomuricauda parva]
MKNAFSYALLLALFFVFNYSNAQELHSHSNAASIANEANSTAGWTMTGSTGVSSVQNDAYHGSYNLKIEATAAGWAIATYEFNTEIGAVYNISLYAKAASSKTPGFFLWEGFSDFASQSISSSTWTLYAFSLTAVDSTAKIKVYTGNTFPAAIGDAAYIDHISIQKVPSDTQAPTAPSLSSNGQTDTTVDLSWSGATDNIGVTGYKVFRDSNLEATLNNVNSHEVTGLTANTAYSFTVIALDAAGNESSASTALSVTTDNASDTQDPSTPTNLSSSGNTDTTADLSWDAATDNIGVTNYKVFKDGNLEATLGNVTNYQVTGLTASTTYSFTVSALDAADNESTPSTAVSVTTDSASGGGGSGSSVWSEAGSVASYTGNVAIGTSSVPSGYKLAVDGHIRTREIRVDQDTWPDYVFKEGYDLPTLKEVEKYIKEKGHLPNIPSAKEVETNGVELGEMNKLLLEKVEELTLYIIKQENSHKNELETLEKRISHIEKNYKKHSE